MNNRSEADCYRLLALSVIASAFTEIKNCEQRRKDTKTKYRYMQDGERFARIFLAKHNNLLQLWCDAAELDTEAVSETYRKQFETKG